MGGKEMKKKVLAVILAATMVLGLAACGSNSAAETAKTEEAAPAKEESKEEAAAPAPAPEPSAEEKLLTEIRDLLKNK